MNPLACLIVLVAGMALPPASTDGGELDALNATFLNLYGSLQAKGGVAAEDHAVIDVVRQRARGFNQSHPDHPRGLALELQLSLWLRDEDRVNELYGRLTTVTGDPEIGLAWARYFESLNDRRKVGEVFDRLFTLFPEDARIRLGWAGFFKDVNLYARAMEIIESGPLDPAENPRAAIMLSECLFAEHELRRAFEVLESIAPDTLAADPALARQVEQMLNERRPYPELWEQEQQIRSAEASADDLPRVEVITTRGRIVVELFENEAPNTVANFISLADASFWEETTFHRVIPNLMAQGGDPNSRPGATGTPGSGSPGYRIQDEHDREGARKHFTGSLAMAKTTAPHTGGCQFYFTHQPTPHLNGRHTVFGRVIDGLDVARALEQDDVIESVTVLRRRDHEYVPQTLPDTPGSKPPASLSGIKPEDLRLDLKTPTTLPSGTPGQP